MTDRNDKNAHTLFERDKGRLRDRREQINVAAIIMDQPQLREYPRAISLATARVKHPSRFHAGHRNPDLSFAPARLITANITSREPARIDGSAKQRVSLRMFVCA